MKYCKECSLEDFDAWSGGRDTLEFLVNHGLCDRVESMIEDVFMFTETPTDTEINDFLRFETDEIAELLGYPSWEDMENDLEGNADESQTDC